MALTYAMEEARALRHNYLGQEHILIGLTRVADSGAAHILSELGATEQRVRDAVIASVGHGTREVTGEVGYTPRAKRAMELAMKELHGRGLGDGNRFIAADNMIARRHAPVGKSLSVTISNGEFKAAEQDGDIATTVIGKVDGKNVSVTNISIYEPGVKLNYDNLENVPEKYRERVKKLISNASGDSGGSSR